MKTVSGNRVWPLWSRPATIITSPPTICWAGTLARDGSMLTPEEVLDMAGAGANVLQGSVLATRGASSLPAPAACCSACWESWATRPAINAAADSLGCQIYLLYRMLHRAAGGSPEYFALPEEDCASGTASAGASLAQADYARAIRNLAREKANFPDLSHEAVNNAYPGRSQGFVQVLSTADGQLNRLNQMERNG